MRRGQEYPLRNKRFPRLKLEAGGEMELPQRHRHTGQSLRSQGHLGQCGQKPSCEWYCQAPGRAGGGGDGQPPPTPPPPPHPRHTGPKCFGVSLELNRIMFLSHKQWENQVPSDHPGSSGTPSMPQCPWPQYRPQSTTTCPSTKHKQRAAQTLLGSCSMWQHHYSHRY